MLDFSCTEALLANWIVHQVGNHPDALFPARKGWKCHLNLFYPKDGVDCYFLVVFADGNDCIAFIALDESCKEDWVGNIKRSRIEKIVGEKWEQKPRGFQCIFLTCERLRNRFRSLLLNFKSKTELLVMSENRVRFAKGQFENSLFDFRLNRQILDPDLLPVHIPPNYGKIENGREKAIFYQNVFHSLNRCWASGKQRIELDRLLADSILYWPQYRRWHRKKLQMKIAAELNILFEKFFPDLARLQFHQKKACSHPIGIVEFLPPLQDAKAFRRWVRLQFTAIQWMYSHFHNAPIDIFSFMREADRT